MIIIAFHRWDKWDLERLNDRPGMTNLVYWILSWIRFPDSSAVKNPPARQEIRVRTLGWDDPWEKEMSTHSSILAWGIPGTEEPGGLQPTGPQPSDLVPKPPAPLSWIFKHHILCCYLWLPCFQQSLQSENTFFVCFSLVERSMQVLEKSKGFVPIRSP